MTLAYCENTDVKSFIALVLWHKFVNGLAHFLQEWVLKETGREGNGSKRRGLTGVEQGKVRLE